MYRVLPCVLIVFVFSGEAVAQCWTQAGTHYGVDPALLKAIAWKESRGRSDAVGPVLSDGNRAVGLMQINTIHLPALKKFGLTRQDLFNPCVSQHVGAWVLSDCVQRFGSTWKAVGCYYTGPASKNLTAQLAYARDVHRYYQGYRAQQEPLSEKGGGIS